MKYKVGQKVRVVKKINEWHHYYWPSAMNDTLGEVFKVLSLSDVDEKIDMSSYLLNTSSVVGHDYVYSELSLSPVDEQMVFTFYETENS